MMKKLVFIACTLLLTSCFSYQDVVYKSFEGINIEKIDGDALHIGISVKVFNPNAYAITIKEAELKGNFNGKDLGDITLMNNLSIGANKESVQKIVCKVSSSKLMAMVPMAFLTGNAKLSLTGNLKAKVYMLSKNLPVNISENINLGDFSLK